MALKTGFWSGRRYHLDKMDLPDLIKAYVQYYAIQGYVLVAGLALWFTFTHMSYTPAGIARTAAAAAAAVIIYPAVWHALHKYILHGRWLFRMKWTAATWKRIHYDHHQDPHDLSILFGALYTTLPTIFVATVPLGWLIGGRTGAAAALAAGLLTTCFYEFCHCIQHLSYKPKWKWVARIKQLHLLHHFHNEQINYGITNYWIDKLTGSYVEGAAGAEKSPTVFNLGYTEAEAALYPWVAERSGGVSNDNPRQRRQKLGA